MKIVRLPGAALLGLLVLLGSCSINRMAMNAVSDALTGGGSTAVFSGDSDPELVGDALPFAIKMYEALLDGNPKHQGLILTTGSLFVMYANAFVQTPAQMLPQDLFGERDIQYRRAKDLYLRGANICLRGLELRYPGFGNLHKEEKPELLLKKTKKTDVPLLYWTVAGLLSAYSLDPFDLDLGTRVPALKLMIDRAYELDPDFNKGALDEFYLLYYASLPESLGGNKALVETYFQRALEKSGGLSAGPYVSYAQSVCIPAQDYDTFRDYLETALSLDVNRDPENRLVNILSQRKARYLLDSADGLFISLSSDDMWYDDDDEYDY